MMCATLTGTSGEANDLEAGSDCSTTDTTLEALSAGSGLREYDASLSSMWAQTVISSSWLPWQQSARLARRDRTTELASRRLPGRLLVQVQPQLDKELAPAGA